MEQLKGLGRSALETEAVDTGWDAFAVWKERVLLARQGRSTDEATAGEPEVAWKPLTLVPPAGR